MDVHLPRGDGHRLLHAHLEAELRAVRRAGSESSRPEADQRSNHAPDPAILGEACEISPTIESSSGVKLDLLARKSGNALYVFAVNYDERRKPAEATIKVAGLPAEASVEVVDEGRTLRSAEGAFRDNFAPLAVHVYRIVMR